MTDLEASDLVPAQAAAMPPALGPGKRLGTLEVAALLGCHPMTIGRLVATKRLSAPVKWLNKNLWTEEQIAGDVAKLLGRP
jgi:hypothetical protein